MRDKDSQLAFGSSAKDETACSADYSRHGGQIRNNLVRRLCQSVPVSRVTSEMIARLSLMIGAFAS